MSAINSLVLGGTANVPDNYNPTNPLAPYFSLTEEGQRRQRERGQQGSFVKKWQQENKVGPYREGGMGDAMYGGVQSTVQPGATALTQPERTVAPAEKPETLPGLTDYDSYIDKSFSHAMRTLGPEIQQNEDRFNQSMIDRGLSAGSEAYGQAFDNNSRRYNDLISAAAFNAMNFGANRLDSDRNFDLNELATIDSMNRAWDGIGFRNAQFNTSREDQRFNQMLSLFGMTPVGSTVPFNAGGAVNANTNADLAALNARNNFYGQSAQGITDAVAGIDWGSIFGNRNSSVVPPGTGIDGSNIDGLLNSWLGG